MTQDDIEQCRELLELSFPVQAKRNAEALTDMENEPWCAPSDRMVCEIDGKVVSHAAIRTGDLWTAGFSFPAARIGMVATHPDHRHQRIASAVIDKACTEAASRGAAVAIAYAPGACARLLLGLGFCRGIFSRPAWQLDLEKSAGSALKRAVDAAAECEFRAATIENAGSLDNLYFQHFSKLTGCWSRNESFWTRRIQGAPSLWLHPAPEILVTSAEGKMLAYIVVSKEHSRWDVLEFACVTGYEFLVAGGCAKIALEADEQGARWLGIDVSYADTVARDLVSLGLRGHVRYEDVFIRVLDEQAIVERTYEAVDLRAVSEKTSCSLEIRGMPPKAIGRGDTDFVLSMSAEELAVAMYNGASLQGLISGGRAKLEPPSPLASAAVRKLFPETHAFRSRFDI